jgi:hypothetical protein
MTKFINNEAREEQEFNKLQMHAHSMDPSASGGNSWTEQRDK